MITFRYYILVLTTCHQFGRVRPKTINQKQQPGQAWSFLQSSTTVCVVWLSKSFAKKKTTSDIPTLRECMCAVNAPPKNTTRNMACPNTTIIYLIFNLGSDKQHQTWSVTFKKNKKQLSAPNFSDLQSNAGESKLASRKRREDDPVSTNHIPTIRDASAQRTVPGKAN